MVSAASPSALPIDAYGDGGFRINDTRYDGAVLILAGQVKPWPVAGDAKALTGEDFAPLLTRSDRPDMVVLGLGARLIHPSGAVRKAFREAGIGLEVLDTATACRTYNLLAGEGRKVAAALFAV